MAEARYELKLDTGKVVTWTGADETDAAVRYVDCMWVVHGRQVAVVATRPADRHGIFVLGRGTITP